MREPVEPRIELAPSPIEVTMAKLYFFPRTNKLCSQIILQVTGNLKEYEQNHQTKLICVVRTVQVAVRLVVWRYSVFVSLRLLQTTNGKLF